MSLKKERFFYLLPFLKLIGPIFFENKYLVGRHFEKDIHGWMWVLRSIFFQKIIGFNRHVPWPVSPFILISDPQNISFDANDLHNFQTFGSYFQNFKAKIYIGKGTYIAPNVGIITANHDPSDLGKYLDGEDVIIGKNCWIGMNAVILPGVELGDHTIVGAGSVVTKSFPDGNVIVAGNPARIIKKVENN